MSSHSNSSSQGCCGNSSNEPRPSSSKSAQGNHGHEGHGQFNPNIDLPNLIGSFLNGSDVAKSCMEAWASVLANSQRPQQQKTKNSNDVQSVLTKDDLFEIKLNVSNFTQDEITIRVENNCIFIETKHEEKQDEHGFITRHLTHRFILPEGILLDKMYSKITSDNVLVLSAPRIVLKPTMTNNERSIPIIVNN